MWKCSDCDKIYKQESQIASHMKYECGVRNSGTISYDRLFIDTGVSMNVERMYLPLFVRFDSNSVVFPHFCPYIIYVLA